MIVKLAKTLSDGAPNAGADKSARERVLNAAFSAFMEHGFEGASTLEVATRAKVSKRELYALSRTSRPCSPPVSTSARSGCGWR